jgi:hypothetical protein
MSVFVFFAQLVVIIAIIGLIGQSLPQKPLIAVGFSG